MSIVGRFALGKKALPVVALFLALAMGCAPAKKLPTDSITPPSLTDFPKEKKLEELPILQLEEKIKKPEPPRVYSLLVRDADIKDVLQGFSKESKANIIVDPEISGKVTIDLKDVTLGQALDALLTPMGLEYKLESGFIRVSKPKPVTRIFRLNYVITRRTGSRSLSTTSGVATAGGGGGTGGGTTGGGTTGGGTTGGGTTGGGGGFVAGATNVVGTDIQDIFREIETSLTTIGLQSSGMISAQGAGGARGSGGHCYHPIPRS